MVLSSTRAQEVVLEDVVFDNPIWIASSPITERYDLIRKVIKAGAGSVILKSSDDFERECAKICNPCGKRKIGIFMVGIGGEEGLAQQKYKDTRIVFSTSENSTHCERLTIEESNKLYKKIKSEFGKNYPVISNFGPSDIDSLSNVSEIEGDVIELNLRFLEQEHESPMNIFFSYKNSVEQNLQSLISKEALTALKKHANKIKTGAKEFLKYKDRPTLLKLYTIPFVNPLLDLDSLLDFDYEGFTIFNSEKNSGYYSKNGSTRMGWGKASISGQEREFWLARHYINSIREGGLCKTMANDKFISASSGIYDIKDVREMLDSANSVQLCSTIYYFGINQVKKIIEDLTSGTSKSNDSIIQPLESDEASPQYEQDIRYWIELHQTEN